MHGTKTTCALLPRRLRGASRKSQLIMSPIPSLVCCCRITRASINHCKRKAHTTVYYPISKNMKARRRSAFSTKSEGFQPGTSRTSAVE